MPTKPILYYVDWSPPVRTVALTAAALGVDLDMKEVDIIKLHHLKPEFIEVLHFLLYLKSLVIFFVFQLNPQHTVPVLDNSGTIVIDSSVISGYLVHNFGTDDKLYPKDPVKRALVDSRLFYNASNVFSRIRFLFEPVFFLKCSELDEWRVKYIESTWEVLDRFVNNTPYVCGYELTIADFAIVSSVSSVSELVLIDPVAYPNLTKWFERMQRLPYYHEANGFGADKVQKMFHDTLVKNANNKHYV